MCDLPTKSFGEYPLEKLPAGWANLEVCYRSGMERYEILDLSSNLRYYQEPTRVTAFKCFELFIGTPFYFMGYTALHFVRLFTVPIANLSIGAFFKELWGIVKIPFLFLGMQFAALYGIFRPLSGRVLFGKLEGMLHAGKTRRDQENLDKKERRSVAEVAHDLFVAEKSKKTSFIGFCMQPLGKKEEPHIIQVEQFQTAS